MEAGGQLREKQTFSSEKNLLTSMLINPFRCQALVRWHQCDSNFSITFMSQTLRVWHVKCQWHGSVSCDAAGGADVWFCADQGSTDVRVRAVFLKSVSPPVSYYDSRGQYFIWTVHDTRPILYVICFTYYNAAKVSKGKIHLGPLFILFYKVFDPGINWSTLLYLTSTQSPVYFNAVTYYENTGDVLYFTRNAMFCGAYLDSSGGNVRNK